MTDSTPRWLAEGAVPAYLTFPPGGASTTGVVVCAPLAQEHILSYRTLRLLTEHLCDAGIASVRFDYAGHGDSVVPQGEPGLTASAGIAAESLYAAGCTEIIYVGLSIGALIAHAAGASDRRTAGVVLWDAPRSGHAWMRSARALYTTTVPHGGRPPSDDTIDVIGGELTPATAAEIESLTLDPPGLSGEVPVVVAKRRGRPGPRLDGSVTIEVPGHEKLLDRDSITARIPGKSVSAIAEAVVRLAGGRGGGRLASPSPSPLHDTVRFSRDPDGGTFTESFVRLGGRALFAIETRREDCPADAPTVILHTGSVEHRIGPARFLVELARMLAAHGIRCLRVDHRGAGETGRVTAEEPSYLYTQEWLEDDADMMRELDIPPERLGVFGHCSGGWIALASSAPACRAIVAYGIGSFDLRTCPPDFVRNSVEQYRQQPSGGRPAPIRSVLKAVRPYLPFGLRRVLAQYGIGEVAENLLAPRVRGGSSVTLLMSPSDADNFHMKSGERSMDRLRRSRGDLTLIHYESEDHALFDPETRRAVRDDACGRFLSAFSPFLDSTVSSQQGDGGPAPHMHAMTAGR